MGLEMTGREIVTALHGLILGGVFLLAFAGAFASMIGLRRNVLTLEGISKHVRRIRWGSTIMAILVWLTVATGTYIVYPWYRAAPPEGTQDLSGYPRSYLLADPSTEGWHRFGIEWKEHIAWWAPIFFTAVAFIAWRYGPVLVENRRLRMITITLVALAFFAAAVAGVFGAFITKAAPVT